jgi:hypothetical protein
LIVGLLCCIHLLLMVNVLCQRACPAVAGPLSRICLALTRSATKPGALGNNLSPM